MKSCGKILINSNRRGKRRAFFPKQINHVRKTPPKNTMAIIAQKTLFGWEQYGNFDGLRRLKILLPVLKDERLMKVLEAARGHGRDDYPVRAVWNSIIAGIVFEHETIESLRRELKRNPALCDICGFEVLKGEGCIPKAGVYSRFIENILKHIDLLKELFIHLREECYAVLPDFGKYLGIDGKAIRSFAKGKSDKHTKDGSNDRRGDSDANWGKHRHYNKLKEIVKTWFGYTIHLIADTQYELPVWFELTKASESEIVKAHEMIDTIGQDKPEILTTCEYFTGDRGYDDTGLIKKFEEHEIAAVIDIRNCWQSPPKTTRALEADMRITHTFDGKVFCSCGHDGKEKKMVCRGYEKDRKAIKYGCPAKYYGITCGYSRTCSIPKEFRIPLATDRRIFTAVPRDSLKWKKMYAMRSALERVNSRLDTMFGFERHTIRGQKKMTFRLTLAYILMIAFALAMYKAKEKDKIRAFLSATG